MVQLQDRPETVSTPLPPKEATASVAKVGRALPGLQRPVLPGLAPAALEGFQAPVPEASARGDSVPHGQEGSQAPVRQECAHL